MSCPIDMSSSQYDVQQTYALRGIRKWTARQALRTLAVLASVPAGSMPSE